MVGRRSSSLQNLFGVGLKIEESETPRKNRSVPKVKRVEIWMADLV